MITSNVIYIKCLIITPEIETELVQICWRAHRASGQSRIFRGDPEPVLQGSDICLRYVQNHVTGSLSGSVPIGCSCDLKQHFKVI